MTGTRSSFFRINYLTVAVLTLGLIIGPGLPPLTASGRTGNLPLIKSRRVSATASMPAASGKSQPADSAARARVIENYGRLPLSFEPNQGQADQSVKFLARGHGYTLGLTAGEAVLRLRSAECGMRNEKTPIPGHRSRAPHSAPRTPHSAVLRLKLVGANTAPQVEGREQLGGRVNYLTGNDRSRWHTDIPTWREVRYSEVWPGIDMVWYGRQRQLEYDFIVGPGADPRQVRLAFEGADRLRLDGEGNLVVRTKAGEVTQHAPVIYQEGEQGRQTVTGKYVLKGRREVGFAIGAYDASRPLVIDPQLVYSSYVGGTGVDFATGVAVDGQGQAYVTGQTDPLTVVGGVATGQAFPYDNSIPAELNVHSTDDVFVTKLNAAGTGTIYSTIISDSDFVAVANGIAVTSDGKACITGSTEATNSIGDGGVNFYPVTANAYQGDGSWFLCGRGFCRSRDAFVTVLNEKGNDLFYSTFFGGSAFTEENALDEGLAIATDSANRVYITGRTRSNNLPTKNAFSKQPFGGTDAFIAVFDPAAPDGLDTLLYASYLGGSGDDDGRGIATDRSGNAYVVGSTGSDDLKAKSPAGQSLPPLQAGFQGGSTDGFVAKIDTGSSGESSLTYLTYFGGNVSDRVEAVAVDADERAYITGASNSSPQSFPLRNAFDSTQTNGEAFVAKLNADGTALFYSSFLGGDNSNRETDGEEGLGIAIDAAGNAYVTGRATSGASFPTGAVAPPFPPNLQGTSFLAKIEASVSSTTVPKLLYATTFGGTGTISQSVALDPKGNVYLAGSTNGNLPTTPGAFQTTFNGSATDGFVAKIGSTFPDTIGVFRPSTRQFLLRNSNTTGNADLTSNFGLSGDLPVTGDWDGDGHDDVGVFQPGSGLFRLLRRPALPCGLPQCQALITNVFFGQAGDLPVAGDWDGDGIDTVGVFRNGTFLLTNSPNNQNSSPPVDITVVLGQAGDIPIVGDWNGDGIDTVGVFRPAAATFFLSNSFDGVVDIPPFAFGQSGFLPLAGDWDGDGVDTIGIFNPGLQLMVLNNSNTTGTGEGDIRFNFGLKGDQPLAGDWDGQP
ncbi:MAG TPA: SBBP repeat-containing protein [Blastocatellia bacterium]|nr:SBBP repeat-containing protein [Blastocatellia bacterium]